MVQGAIIASQNANSAGEWVGYIFGGGAIGALSGLAGAALASSSIGVAGMVSGAISGAGFSGMSSGGDFNRFSANALVGTFSGAIGGLFGGWIASAIGGTSGAFFGGMASGAIGSAISGRKGLDILYSSLVGGIGSASVYQLSSVLGWATSGRCIDGLDISYRQYLTMQADFQRSMFWRKEYGGYLLSNGKVQRAPMSARFRNNVDLGLPRPSGEIAEYHIHWEKPNEIFAWRDDFGNMGAYEDFPVGTHITAQISSQYHGVDDFTTGGFPSLVINRYDASLYNGGPIHWGWPLNYEIVRFFMFFGIL